MTSVRSNITSDSSHLLHYCLTWRVYRGLALCAVLYFSAQHMGQEWGGTSGLRQRSGFRFYMSSENGCRTLKTFGSWCKGTCCSVGRRCSTTPNSYRWKHVPYLRSRDGHAYHPLFLLVPRAFLVLFQDSHGTKPKVAGAPDWFLYVGCLRQLRYTHKSQWATVVLPARLPWAAMAFAAGLPLATQDFTA